MHLNVPDGRGMPGPDVSSCQTATYYLIQQGDHEAEYSKVPHVCERADTKGKDS